MSVVPAERETTSAGDGGGGGSRESLDSRESIVATLLLETELESAIARVVELELDLKAATQQNSLLEEEVRVLHGNIGRERDKYNTLWRMNCEQLKQHDEELALKEGEVQGLGARIAELEHELQSQGDVTCPACAATVTPERTVAGEPTSLPVHPTHEVGLHSGPEHGTASGGLSSIMFSHHLHEPIGSVSGSMHSRSKPVPATPLPRDTHEAAGPLPTEARRMRYGPDSTKGSLGRGLFPLPDQRKKHTNCWQYSATG